MYNIIGNVTFYYANEYIIYKLPIYDLEDEGINRITNNPYNLFIAKNNDSIGYLYDFVFLNNGIKKNDSIFNRTNWKKIKTDSILNARGFNKFNVYDILKNSKQVYSKTENKTDNIVIRAYQPNKIIDDTYNDTTMLYFSSALKNINFSFSKELDSVENLKLFKIRLIYNERFSNQYKITMPKHEFSFEINELVASDSLDIIKLLEKLFN